MTEELMNAGRRLDGEIGGRVVQPGDAGYDEARAIWNGLHERRPAAVVQATGVEDVQRALQFGREHGLEIAVRGGGHGVAGNGTVDDGLVIDLGPMQSVKVDPDRRTVRVEGGATLGIVDRATEPHRLVVPLGVISGTGVAGLTLGGGVGWLTRTFGLTIDNLLSADLVTADGGVVRANAQADADLFWGIRGGGGNFGIVTAFEFQAHPLGPEALSGVAVYRRDGWAEALGFFSDWASGGLPDALTPIVSFITPPASWGLPEALTSDQLMFAGFAWAGRDPDEGRRAVEPLMGFGPPALTQAEPTRWVELQSSADELFPKGVRAYWKSLYFDHLDGKVIETIVEHAARRTSPRAGVDIHLMGGAFARVQEEETAFPNRAARYWLNIYAVWDDPAHDEAQVAWTRDFHAAMDPHAAQGMYVNFQGAEADADPLERAREAYGPDKLARLQRLKARYDPENVFRRNHNIPPESGPDRPT